MRDARFFSIATAAVVALNLGAVSVSSADAAQRGSNAQCVAVSGGTVQNATVLDVAADGGTGIGDASGGSGNLAAASGNDHDRNNDNHRNNNNNNNHRNNRNNWSAMPLQSLQLRLQQTETASSGNGGVATVAADGGAVSIQDINSGGNVGNAISVGDTTCAPFTPPAPAPEKPKDTPKEKAPRPEKVVALPDTGVGIGDASALFALITSAGAAAASLGLRRR